MFKHVAFGALIGLTLFTSTGCKQEIPKTLPMEPVFGTIQDLREADNTKELLYQQGEDTSKKPWGLAGAYWVTIDDKKYLVSWEDAAKFKTLKVGEKVNLHPTSWIACIGENEIKPTCYTIMNVFKISHQVNPLVIH